MDARPKNKQAATLRGVTALNTQLVVNYLRWLRLKRGCSPRTLRTYEYALMALVGFLGLTRVEHATTERLEAFLDRTEGRASSTKAKEVATLRGFYRWLLSRGFVTRNPSLLMGTPKVPHAQPRALRDATWLRWWLGDLDDATRITLGLGFFLGLRCFEMCELRPEQVDTDTGLLVNFSRKGGGTDTMPYRDLCELWADRMPQLRSDLFTDLLDVYVAKRADSVWLLPFGEGHTIAAYRASRLSRSTTQPEQTTVDQVGHLFTRLHRVVGGPKVTAHALRHSFCTNLLRAGVPIDLVTELANHSSPTLTWRYVRQGGGRLGEWMRRGDRP